MYEVTIRGEWQREQTWVSDARLVRVALTRPFAEECGITNGTFVRRRFARVDGVNYGPFEVTVCVASNKQPAYVNGSTLRARATQLLRWWLADVTCTPPKLVDIELVSFRKVSVG